MSMVKKTTRKIKPTNNGSRNVVLIEKRHLWSGRPEKTLTVSMNASGGRNNRGVITVRHIGGGHKKLYRMIDFKRQKDDMSAQVLRLEYDPNRTAFIALIKYEDDTLSYILATEGMKVGDKVMSGTKADINPGCTLPMDNIPIGTNIHNVELVPGRGGVISRSAGSFVVLSGKELGFAILRMPSGELRRISLDCKATVGIVSNASLCNESLGKAGRNRWRGKRPCVRGTKMNPVDHHNGGRSMGKIPMNAQGTVRKGQKTRKNNKFGHLIIKGRKGNTIKRSSR